jgi:catechol 2,3-dioxygenase-like lactoylglutathione lyase family enzyme
LSFDYQQALFHVGIRVPDLAASMAELGTALGVTWAEVMEREQPLWTPEDGAITTPLRFTYSCEGPVHLELLQGTPGTIWYGDDQPGVHHLGIWVDDVAECVERLVAEGWELVVAQLAPEDGYGVMAYVRSSGGILLEPVSSAVRPRFERWWAGGSLM